MKTNISIFKINCLNMIILKYQKPPIIHKSGAGKYKKKIKNHFMSNIFRVFEYEIVFKFSECASIV